MEKLLASEFIGILIQVVGAIIASIVVELIIERRSVKRSFTPPPPSLVGWVTAGVVAAVMFSVIGFAYNQFTPTPTVDIASPLSGQGIEVQVSDTAGKKSGGLFVVTGNSQSVSSDPNLRVYVLVHPSTPWAAGWWIQSPANMQSDGRWSTKAWIGDAESPPNVGDQLDIVGITASPSQVQNRSWVNDPKDLKPKGQSYIVNLIIKSIN